MPSSSQLDPNAIVLVAEDAMQAMTDDLAQTFGPEEAKRIAFSEELGSCSGSTGAGRSAVSACARRLAAARVSAALREHLRPGADEFSSRA
jgi:hypothetical protein